MKKILLIITTIFCILNYSYSQDYSNEYTQQLSFSYNLSFPTGDFKDLISETSVRGFNIEYDYFVMDILSIGGSVNWNGFYEEKEKTTYIFESPPKRDV